MIRRTAPLNGLPKSWLQIGQASQCPVRGATMAANRRWQTCVIRRSQGFELFAGPDSTGSIER